jgi:hypothetical protein
VPMGLAFAHLVRMAHNDDACEARDGHRLASAGLSAFLDVVWAARMCRRNSGR